MAAVSRAEEVNRAVADNRVAAATKEGVDGTAGTVKIFRLQEAVTDADKPLNDCDIVKIFPGTTTIFPTC